MSIRMIKYGATIALLLALFVVMLGAYTRLTDAGLGCPDWPGCYGHMVLPSAQAERQNAQSQFPEIPIEGRKAWTEMAHRYAAGTLGLLILFLAGSLLRLRMKGKDYPLFLPVLLIVLLFFQAALGMWTVTLKLLPVVVMGHLLGGIVLFASLVYLRLRIGNLPRLSLPKPFFWVVLGVVIVFLQIALGGWVSSNYAGIACIGFPQCNGQWFPSLHLAKGFDVFAPVGDNYQGGLLEHSIRVTIQYVHRLGAYITAMYVVILAVFLLRMRPAHKNLRCTALFAILLVVIQFTLGVLNVVYLLPLSVAVAHNGVAALLLGTLVTLAYLTGGRRSHAN